ncbi:ATP-binding cassette domain-containing protein, partial [Rhizobium leguminosarum]|uniref:ATP-binding cassette domain-containing protein n=1 Tax=Rhizobium leguminosarum TaxID=384 RepID=UPI003F9E9D6C
LKVLDDVELSLPAGSVTAILGPSGSVKSTLLRAINHLERVDEGFISVDGDLETRASARAVPRMETDMAASTVKSSVLPRPTSTGSAKNHSAKTLQPQRGLVKME